MHTEAVWNKKTCMGLPGGPVVKVLQWKLQVCEFDLWLGNSDPSCSWGAIKKKKNNATHSQMVQENIYFNGRIKQMEQFFID